MEQNLKIYGLVGQPVKHSLSSAMHNAAFSACGIKAEYRLFEVKPQDLKDFLFNPDMQVEDTQGRFVRAGDIAGFNITVPHKVRAKEMLEEKFPYKKSSLGLMLEAEYYVQLSGAVNAVARPIDYSMYWNTDCRGFFVSLREDLKFDPSDKNTFVFGCGGAGRAVIAALSWKQVGAKKIFVYDINEKAVSVVRSHFSTRPYLAEKLEFVSSENVASAIERCDLLVNASSVGMKKGDGSVVSKDLLHKDLFVYDVVYNRDTKLIRDAKSLGLPAAGGLSMLLYQGAAAFELWTGSKAPVEVMKQALGSQKV